MNRTKYAAGKHSLHECFSKRNMLDKMRVKTETMEIDVSRWIDEMPSKYRDIATEACLDAADNYIGRKANQITLRAFIDEVYENVLKDSRMKL